MPTGASRARLRISPSRFSRHLHPSYVVSIASSLVPVRDYDLRGIIGRTRDWCLWHQGHFYLRRDHWDRSLCRIETPAVSVAHTITASGAATLKFTSWGQVKDGRPKGPASRFWNELPQSAVELGDEVAWEASSICAGSRVGTE